LRTRVRRVEWSIEDFEERLMKEDRRRAAAASVNSRTKARNAVDDAVLRAVESQGQQLPLAAPAPAPRPPWWAGLTTERREKGNGS